VCGLLPSMMMMMMTMMMVMIMVMMMLMMMSCCGRGVVAVLSAVCAVVGCGGSIWDKSHGSGSSSDGQSGQCGQDAGPGIVQSVAVACDDVACMCAWIGGVGGGGADPCVQVFDSKNDAVTFGSLFEKQKALIIFVRHFL
jgi:hypothetical protein